MKDKENKTPESKSSSMNVLEEMEQNFRNTVDNSPLGIRITNEDGELTYANQAILDIYGYGSFEEFKNTPIKKRLTPASYAEYLLRTKKRKRGESASPENEIEIIRKDGEVRNLTVNRSKVVWDGEVQYQSFYQDITERKQTEEALKVTEQNFRNTMDKSPIGIRIIASENEINYANQAILDIYGYDTIDELKNTLIEQRLTPTSFKQYWIMKEKVEEGETIPSEYDVEIVRRDGETRNLTVSRTEVNWDGKVQYLMLSQDITERKRADEQLRYQANLIDNVSDAIISMDMAHKIVSWNKAAEKIYGWKQDEVIGRYIRDILPDELMNANNQEVVETIQKNGFWQGEIAHLRKDGTQVKLLSSAILLRDDQGRATGSVVISRDITESKVIEERQKQMQQELIANSRLATIGQMAAGIAHEINNPLTGVIGYSELLMKENLPEDIKDDIKMIAEGGQRVADIVRRMLTFARQTKPMREIVSINEIIETTLEMRASAMKTSNINVTTRLDPELPKIMADGGQLHQVILNIVLNAESAMKNAHSKGKLHVKTEEAKDDIRVAFTDDGPGIAPEDLEKIFDPFYTTSEVGQGTGLGLSICHGIIADHNGRISAESKQGKGATIIVELPIIIQAEQLKPDEPEIKELANVSPSKVLIVDDEPIVQRYLSDALVGTGHQVEIIDNGNEAIEKLKHEECDVILLDIKLPGKDGIEIYQYLQNNYKQLAMKVIFITGDVMGQETQSFLSKTKAQYITKPIDLNKLSNIINEKLSTIAEID